jgi:hypothetical protein
MKHLTALLILLLTTAISAHRPSAENFLEAPRVEKWRQDLNVLATELPQRHLNLFFKLSRKEFERQVAELDKSLPTLSDSEIVAALKQIIASVGDAHTTISWPPWFRYYPLGLYWFDDSLYVVTAAAAYRQALGARVVQIGNADVSQALAAVSRLIPHENETWVRSQSPMYLVQADLVHALKIVPEAEQARFVFQDDAGNTFSLDVPALANSEKVQWLEVRDEAKSPMALYRKNPEANYWYEYLADTRLLFLKYNRCQNTKSLPFKKFAGDLFRFADTHPIDKFVIDLRHNIGGVSDVTEPLITGLKKRPALTQPGRLFIIIGRRTFSSGVLNALELHEATGAILVGEPTGGKPNGFGNVREFVLPNSRLTVVYTTKYFELTKQFSRLRNSDPDSLMPDVPIKHSFAGFLAGRDAALETILAYQPR